MERQLALAEKITKKIWAAMNKEPLPMKSNPDLLSLPRSITLPVIDRLHVGGWGIDSAIDDFVGSAAFATMEPESPMQERVELLAFAIAGELLVHIDNQQQGMQVLSQTRVCIDTLGQNRETAAAFAERFYSPLTTVPPEQVLRVIVEPLKRALAEKLTEKIWDALGTKRLPMQSNAVLMKDIPDSLAKYRLRTELSRGEIDSAIHDLAVNSKIMEHPGSSMQERVEQLALAIADALYEHIAEFRDEQALRF